MPRYHRFALLLLTPILAVVLATAGCSNSKKEENKVEDKKEKQGEGDKSGGGPAGAPQPLAGKGLGVLKGQVTFAGDPPARADLSDRIKEQGDKDHCLKGDTKDPTWMVDPGTKAVQNVVVWLRAPKGKYFQIPDDQKKWPADKPVTIDQPFCAFEPHVVAVFPSYFDGKKQIASGQKFKVLNSAPIGHNTAWEGNKLFNQGKNDKINPKSEMDVPAKACPDSKTGEDLISIRCDLHKWMSAYAWAFDHPYAAVTKADGTYEIKNVPTGVELEVVYWHESFGKAGKAKTATLKDGDNPMDFTIGK